MLRKNLAFIFKYIAVLTGLIILGAGCIKDSTNLTGEGPFEPIGFTLRQNGVDIVSYEDGSVSGEIEIEEGFTTPLIRVRFIDKDGNEGLTDNDEFSLDLNIEDENIASIVQHTEEDWSFHIKAESHGHTYFMIIIIHGGRVDYESGPIEIHITEPGG